MYYFGVWPGTGAGHYLHDCHGNSVSGWPERNPVIPWGYEIDTNLCPGGKNAFSLDHQGKAAIHRKDGWIALSFWDSSEDKRGASNSGFFIQTDEELSFGQLVTIFREAFPKLWERFDRNFVVKLVMD